MMKHSIKIGAIFYLLWGIIHIIGGASMLYAASFGPDMFVKMMAGNMDISLSETSDSLALLTSNEVFKYHSFNIVWLGFVTSVVAIRMNWKNSHAGFWFNLALVGFTDLGLVIFMVSSSIMTLLTASPGLILFAFAFTFSWLAKMNSRPIDLTL